MGAVYRNFCLHPNALKDPELIKEWFFLLEKSKLIENMDKDVEDQTAHIQTKTSESLVV